jgi:GNAT superfamily N-acetyltransferase
MSTVMGEVRIRRALPEEAGALTELIMRSKAHWGYDAAFLEACRPGLTMRRESIERDHVVCAEVGGDLAGVAHVATQDDGEAYLDDLFVEPAYMGRGVGKLLWGHAVAWAAATGATAMVFGADPNARPFYEHLGAVVVGEIASTIISGRTTPRMRYDLPRGEA